MQFFHPISRNPWEVIILDPVVFNLSSLCEQRKNDHIGSPNIGFYDTLLCFQDYKSLAKVPDQLTQEFKMMVVKLFLCLCIVAMVQVRYSIKFYCYIFNFCL